MNLRKEILEEHSKARCDRIVQWVGDSQQRFDELMNLFFCNEYRVVQRAAWPLSYCVSAHPQLIRKHLDMLVKNLQKTGIHNAVKRNSIRLLQYIEIPELYQGDIMELCFLYISSPREAAAVKAFSLTVLENLCTVYPEILPEIKLIIEERLPDETPAFRIRARKLLKNTKGH